MVLLSRNMLQMTKLNSDRRKRMQVRWAMGNHAALQAAEEARKAQAYLLAQQIKAAQELAEAQVRGQWIEQQEAADAAFVQDAGCAENGRLPRRLRPGPCPRAAWRPN